MMLDMRIAAARALRFFGSVSRREEGQALVEYALVLFLVAVVVIGILGTLGTAVSSMFSVVNAEF
jgi:pilus assembly protein Flp/PilA